MAEKPTRGKGKRPVRPPRRTYGRFLPRGTDSPKLPSVVAVKSPFPPNDDDDGPPVTSRGLVMLGPTSRVLFNLASSSSGAIMGTSGESERRTPPRKSLTPRSLPQGPEAQQDRSKCHPARHYPSRRPPTAAIAHGVALAWCRRSRLPVVHTTMV